MTSPRFDREFQNDFDRSASPIHIKNQAADRDSAQWNNVRNFQICFSTEVKCTIKECKELTPGGFICPEGHIVPLCLVHKPVRRIICRHKHGSLDDEHGVIYAR